ncbi:MAG: winged helix-turn-helix transcriptional regulator [Candidatus Marinimicrobia bacterium]|nr:winged helix-turn-helix transcriptional regulator [Candidatus Neomarinimicrobiota bacterium]
MKDNHKCAHLDQSILEELKGEVSDFPKLESASETFAMLGDPTRLRILFTLSKTGQCCVYHLAEIMGMGVSAISHHLRKLRDRRLVTTQRDGLNIYYSVSKSDEAKGACNLARKILGVK